MPSKRWQRGVKYEEKRASVFIQTMTSCIHLSMGTTLPFLSLLGMPCAWDKPHSKLGTAILTSPSEHPLEKPHSQADRLPSMLLPYSLMPISPLRSLQLSALRLLVASP